jgi:hypothetical protein
MTHPAWTLIILGALIVLIGVVWLVAPAFPWLGRLPGDIVLERDNVRVVFPVTTCLVLSALLTGLMWLTRYFSR